MAARRLAFVLVAVLAAASLQSCTKPAETPVPTPTSIGKPYLSEKEAFDLMGKLSDVNNNANAKRDSTILATYEAESQFAIDDAIYVMGRVEDPTNAKTTKPYVYTPQKAYIPAGDKYPQFILMDCTLDDTTVNVEVVMTREKAGDDWKVVYSLVQQDKVFPELDIDQDSNAITVAPDDAEGMVDSPANIAKAQAAWLTNGASAAEAKLFGANKRTDVILTTKTGLVDSLQFTNPDTGAKEKATKASFTVTVSPYPVRALRTRDGGAIAFYTTSMEFVAEHPNGTAKISGKDAALAGKADFQRKLTLIALDQWMVYIPPKDGGKVEVLTNLTGRVSIV